MQLKKTVESRKKASKKKKCHQCANSYRFISHLQGGGVGYIYFVCTFCFFVFISIYLFIFSIRNVVVEPNGR